MTTGDSNDIVQRVKALIPRRWFAWVAPYRDALLGGLADLASGSFSLIGYARSQTRLFTAYGVWLDLLSFDFMRRYLLRNGMSDTLFRTVIKATVLQERVTRAGMISALTTLTRKTPLVFEPWNTNDTGAYSGPRASGAPQYGSMGYGVGQGGYGNMNLPGQAFIKVFRGAGSGIPGVGGYTNNISGWGVGSIEYAGPLTELSGITNDMINNLIAVTKPTGTTIWVAVGAPPVGSVGNGMPKRPAIMNSKNNSGNIVII